MNQKMLVKKTCKRKSTRRKCLSTRLVSNLKTQLKRNENTTNKFIESFSSQGFEENLNNEVDY